MIFFIQNYFSFFLNFTFLICIKFEEKNKNLIFISLFRRELLFIEKDIRVYKRPPPS